jgi:hypothetical protein
MLLSRDGRNAGLQLRCGCVSYVSMSVSTFRFVFEPQSLKVKKAESSPKCVCLHSRPEYGD